jgi:mono/diheme cytochrome c family protein
MRLKALLMTVVLGFGMIFAGCGTGKQGASSSQKSKQSATKSTKSDSSKSSKKSTSSTSSGTATGEKTSATRKSPPASPSTTGTTTSSGNPTGSNAAAAALFQKKCQVCHGPGGVGASAPKLDAGLRARFTTQSALQTFVRKNMPFNDPGTLSDAQAAALARYLWSMQKS